MSGHGHSHSCGGCDHDEHFEIATDFELHARITPQGFECLGEEDEGSGRKVFKDYDNRKNKSEFVISDCDPELLFNIPFDGNIKLKSLIVIGGGDDTQPINVKLYKNKPAMTFDDTSKDADQVIDLVSDPNGEVQYPVKTTKFNNVYHLSMFFPQSTGEEQTKVYYIGLRGEFTKVNREAIVISNYEVVANPADHKTKAFGSAAHSIQ